jgi:hypothetical protein
MISPMNSFFGIPAHPLLVHVPVVLLPLTALGVVVMVIRPAWHRRYRWAVLGVGVIATFGAILAASAGDSLGERVEAKNGAGGEGVWEHHAELGDTARLVAIIFVIVLAAYVLVPWYLERRAAQDNPLGVPSWLTAVLAALALLASAASVYTIIQAGHSGAKAVWCETNTPPNCDTGGD